MSFTIVKFIVVDNNQTSELCIEKRRALFNHEELFSPNYYVVSRETERLILHDNNNLHLVTPIHYVVKIYSTNFSKEETLFKDNVSSMKNFLIKNDAVFHLQAAIVRIDSRMYRAFITARPNSLFRYVENDDIMYEQIL